MDQAHNPMDLFLALLAPDIWGGVKIPKQFQEGYQYALRNGIAPGSVTLDEALSEIESKDFSSVVRTLYDVTVPHMQSLALNYVDTAMLRLYDQDHLVVSMVKHARDANTVFKNTYGDEYGNLRELFPQLFASRFRRPREVFDNLGRKQEYMLDTTLL